MDLRVVKTKKSIREAFLALRKDHFLEDIKVKDICDKALINKSTFYKYYKDVFELSDELENEAVNIYFRYFDNNSMILENPEEFLKMNSQAFEDNKEYFHLVFNNRMRLFFQRIEERIKEYYINNINSDYDDIKLSFIITGAVHALGEFKYKKKYDDKTIIENISKLIKKLSDE